MAKKSVELGWAIPEEDKKPRQQATKFVSNADAKLGPVAENDVDRRGPRDDRSQLRGSYDRRGESQHPGYDRRGAGEGRGGYDRRGGYEGRGGFGRDDDRRPGFDRRGGDEGFGGYDRRGGYEGRGGLGRDDDFRYPPRGGDDRRFRDDDRAPKRFNDDRRPRQDNEPSNGLIVFGLPPHMTNPDFNDFVRSTLRDFPGRFDSNLVEDRETRRCKGFGFVSFDSIDDAIRCKSILLSVGTIDGAELRVDFSRPRNNNRQRNY